MLQLLNIVDLLVMEQLLENKLLLVQPLAQSEEGSDDLHRLRHFVLKTPSSVLSQSDSKRSFGRFPSASMFKPILLTPSKAPLSQFSNERCNSISIADVLISTVIMMHYVTGVAQYFGPYYREA